MPDDTREPGGVAPGGAGAPDEDSGPPPPSSPFDNPWFLPALLYAMALWFGYDGWFNEEMEWVGFNRGGFVVLILLAVYFTVQGIREKRRSG